ncbi:anthranilate synthase component I [Candidatus Methylacidithermus pantelleriae]|uniref:Anthranilate synthase component 1 n=1 Tax=Candidatus Methylacidithermus pantelleriae TaxID=2744239 RepID=A0A8J2BQJ0_9BACT|nr:anthranilate synthase component I [Candidatus Methylacidithermus pantelleriae]CAF0699009.1 Anthranilate synthase component 1 [Candidatus Methylacidithermus pantelleriae]
MASFPSQGTCGTFPDRKRFFELASRGNLIPVYREVVADLDTPVSAFLKVAQGSYSFLLESAERDGRFGRYSFVGTHPAWVLRVRHGRAVLEGRDGVRWVEDHVDPLQKLKKLMDRFQAVAEGDLPPFYGGAVGYLAYEAVTYFEPSVPRASCDDLGLPDACFVLADTLVAFDHLQRKLQLVANAYVENDPRKAYEEAVQKLDQLEDRLRRPMDHRLVSVQPAPPPVAWKANLSKDQYLSMAEKMHQYIQAGDIFQVVPSQRLEAAFEGDPLDLYRALRIINPSPYMFYLNLGDVQIVGSSPEVHVRCLGRKATIRPIAGTRPRGATAQEDEELARELLADPKERAEHVMLVDLARNDLGRVCRFDTVRVTEWMVIEKYSHVMHLVSNVEGFLEPGCTPYDLLRATFPAGTVTGAPKIRAMQILAELEPTCRGVYAGAIGYFSFSGDLDSAIAIRTVVCKNKKAYLQAGGGLVADSTPLGEYRESLSKAEAGLRALALAKSFR